MEKVTRLIAMGGTTRLLRASDAYSSWPGLKLGVEATFFPGDRLNQLGNRNGAASAFLPIPRLYLAKGLFERLEIIGSFFFGGLNTVSSVGALLKWTAIPENEDWLAVAVFGGVTGLTAFNDEFSGMNGEAGFLISKDYVRFKPYAGASLLLASGHVAPALSAVPNSPTLLGTHIFVGMEWELPVNLTVQGDLINSDPFITLFIGKKF